MNKIFLVSMMLFAFSNIYAEKQDSSDSEIVIIINKDTLVNLVKKPASISFGEKVFNISGEVICGAGMGAAIAGALLLYGQTIAINNKQTLQWQTFIDVREWNDKAIAASVAGAFFGGAYGLLNGVYKNFIKN